jgi:alkanesulfonate monooxygenase SsuD/methylene tetrahydromethanopterin reductase-like flavin-dependent oxidoreductase (luciferase family)
LDWLAEAIAAARTLLDGGEVSSTENGRYAFDHLRMAPVPLQRHLPIMIGGGGERKTLRIVAEHADMWNVFGTPEILAHKDEALRAHCTDVGRDPSEIERTVGCKMTIRQSEAEAERVRLALLERNRTPLSRVKDDLTFWTGTPEQIAETMISYRNIGFHTFIAELPAPYDAETMETLVNVVKPMVDAAVPF